MLPGFWEFLLIAVVGGWVIMPFLYRRNQRLKARHAKKNHSSKAVKNKSNYTPPQDVVDVDYEDIS